MNCIVASVVYRLQTPLPPGSQLLFFNAHSKEESIDEVMHLVDVQNVQVQHVHGNPLSRRQMKRKLNLKVRTRTTGAYLLFSEWFTWLTQFNITRIYNFIVASTIIMRSIILIFAIYNTRVRSFTFF